jgi:ABC-type antimicrobial peptide transport system permease subunit
MAPLSTRLEGAFVQTRLRTALLAFFAVAALMLTAIGLAGTLGYVVAGRRREIGVRLALGARRGQIVGDVLLQALRVVGPACAVGLLLTGAASGLLSGMLYGVSPGDPLTLAVVMGLVAAVTLAAALVPALRAAGVEPVTVLRDG